MSKHYVVYMHTIWYIDDDTDTVNLFYNQTKDGIQQNLQKYMQNRKEKLHHKTGMESSSHPSSYTNLYTILIPGWQL